MADTAARDSAKCQSSGAALGSQVYKKCRALLEDKMSIENGVPPDRSYASTPRPISHNPFDLTAPAAWRYSPRPSRLNSDTSHMAGNKHTEEKYERTNRSCNQKTPARVPRLCSSVCGDGPCAFRTFAQIERFYSDALHSQAA
jgi:hypothetical protein